MTVVNLKSISGINSITTGSGSDNLLTIHTSDANNTERVRVNSSGDVIVGSGVTLSPDGDAFFTGVTTATTFVGALTGNVTGNISGGTVAGSTGTFSGAISGTTGTFTSDVTLSSTAPKIVFTDSNNNPDYELTANGGAFTVTDTTNSADRLKIDSAGKVGLGINPSLSLHVYHATNNGILRVESGDSDARIDLKDNGGEVKIHAIGDILTLNTSSSDTERLRIEADGDIGLLTATPNLSGYSSPTTSIGKSGNPYSVLELQGNQTSDGAMGVIVGYNSAGSSRIATINLARKDANNSGAITFDTASSGSLGTRVTISNDGLLFGSDTAAANALDDYEEGTFTFGTTTNSGSVTLGSSYDTGGYVKIGRLVHVSAYLAVSSVSSPSGTFYITGLPFTSANFTEQAAYARFPVSLYLNGDNLPDGHGYYTGDAFIEESQNRLQVLFRGTNTNGKLTTNIDGNVNPGSDFFLNFTYIAA